MTLKLSPSSRVVCRLPSELAVAREEPLWEGCCGDEEVEEEEEEEEIYNSKIKKVGSQPLCWKQKINMIYRKKWEYKQKAYP